MAFGVEEHMATLPTITCQPGACRQAKKELKHGDAAMDEQLFGYRIGCQTQKGRGMEHTDVVDIHSEHTRSTLQPDEPFLDLKCQTRFGCITFEVGRSEQKKKIEWKMKKRK